ncbi:MAG: hypothetical protein ABIS01_08550, partial [Ferruginibacter sp.]
YELSKSDKKIARALIDKGADIEFKITLEQADKIIAEWKSGVSDNRTAYHKLLKNVDERNNRIANRYDGLTGSGYLPTVASIYVDGQITEDDIKGISEETRAVLNKWLELSKR